MSATSESTPTTALPPTFTIVPSEELARLRQLLERMLGMLSQAAPGGGHGDPPDYVEPGPQSVRKYFKPQELAERWGWGKTKVYEIPEAELPSWKKGKSRLYFWAHVWAYEGRISNAEAERLHALRASGLEVLPHPPAKLTRLRPAGTD